MKGWHYGLGPIVILAAIVQISILFLHVSDTADFFSNGKIQQQQAQKMLLYKEPTAAEEGNKRSWWFNDTVPLLSLQAPILSLMSRANPETKQFPKSAGLFFPLLNIFLTFMSSHLLRLFLFQHVVHNVFIFKTISRFHWRKQIFFTPIFTTYIM